MSIQKEKSAMDSHNSLHHLFQRANPLCHRKPVSSSSPSTLSHSLHILFLCPALNVRSPSPCFIRSSTSLFWTVLIIHSGLCSPCCYPSVFVDKLLHHILHQQQPRQPLLSHSHHHHHHYVLRCHSVRVDEWRSKRKSKRKGRVNRDLLESRRR